MKQSGRGDQRGESSASKKIVALAACLFLLLLVSPAIANSFSGGNATERLGAIAISPRSSASADNSTTSQADAELDPGQSPSTSEAAALGAGLEKDLPPSTGATSPDSQEIETDRNFPEGEVELPGVAEEKPVHDPLETWNRLMFHFNDKLYYWVLKPAAKGYNAALPEPVRASVGNFFRNVKAPVRFVSSLLAGRLKAAGIELARFAINSTAGLGGLFDIANQYHLERQESDLGLTFGRYGVGEGLYIVWPFLGPSSLRDTVGTVGDGFLNPVNYITPERDAIAVNAYDYFNYAALHIDDYGDLVESAVEPYVALRNAYIQHRRSLLKK
jgi:phospholipid-binding lipoprotein MlaA